MARELIVGDRLVDRANGVKLTVLGFEFDEILLRTSIDDRNADPLREDLLEVCSLIAAGVLAWDSPPRNHQLRVF